MIESNKEYSNRIYSSNISETTKHYGSVIKTGYNGNSKPYTHPIYLTNDLPGQILTILRDIDRDNIFILQLVLEVIQTKLKLLIEL